MQGYSSNVSFYDARHGGRLTSNARQGHIDDRTQLYFYQLLQLHFHLVTFTAARRHMTDPYQPKIDKGRGFWTYNHPNPGLLQGTPACTVELSQYRTSEPEKQH